jgi:hypothetical protein
MVIVESSSLLMTRQKAMRFNEASEAEETAPPVMPL